MSVHDSPQQEGQSNLELPHSWYVSPPRKRIVSFQAYFPVFCLAEVPEEVSSIVCAVPTKMY